MMENLNQKIIKSGITIGTPEISALVMLAGTFIPNIDLTMAGLAMYQSYQNLQGVTPKNTQRERKYNG